MRKNLRLKGKLFELGLSQKKLGAMPGVRLSESEISMVLNGRMNLDPDRQKAIARALRTTAHFLFDASVGAKKCIGGLYEVQKVVWKLPKKIRKIVDELEARAGEIDSDKWHGVAVTDRDTGERFLLVPVAQAAKMETMWTAPNLEDALLARFFK